MTCILGVYYMYLARKKDLGIAGFGISVTTMEEVFIKVGEGTEETLERRCVAAVTYYVDTVHGKSCAYSTLNRQVKVDLENKR